jgi:hypothetical protein
MLASVDRANRNKSRLSDVMVNEKMPNEPETFGEAQAWAKMREVETGVAPKSVANSSKGLRFDLENSTVTKALWDEDNNLVEMTYCAITGGVLSKKVTKQLR